jgi:hypothetical protein
MNMMRVNCRCAMVAVAFGVCVAQSAAAQTVSQRGFVEGSDTVFAHLVPNDQSRQVVDALYREEIFVKPKPWLQFAGGLDVRANSHDQIDTRWRLDVDDRTILRPAAALRRLAATVSTKYVTVDVGKQFIRWGNADILNPTDRFAPRDYLNVIDTDLIPVFGGRAAVHFGTETFEAVVARFTPSRLPLFDQRWVVLPPAAAGFSIVDGGSIFPTGSQQGARWKHTGEHFEASASFYDGFYNLASFDFQPLSPTALQLTRFYPALRTYGADLAIPTSWFTLKGEMASFTSPNLTNAHEYILYVAELERQAGEWILDGGYIGESVLQSGVPAFRFAPDEQIAKSIIGRASYTVDPRRTVTVEGLLRQSGDGAYVKAQFSDALSSHWRITFTGVGISGKDTDFIGQFNRNSNVSVTLRVSF